MRRALATVAVLGVAYAAWSRAGRRPPERPVELRLEAVVSFGEDQGAGNLVGIQPWVEPGDYASEARFAEKLDGYLAAAQGNGFLSDKTIVIFPEDLATWLVAAGEKRGVWQAKTVGEATRTLAFSNPLPFLWWLARAPCEGRARHAAFRMKGESMARSYHRVFSALARRYRVTMVAGSIYLPSPRVEDGVVAAGNGPLYNVGAVYRPDGRAEPTLVKKAYLVEDEKQFVAPGRVDDVPVFETPAGRLGVLICADSWYPESYAHLRERRAELIAVPSYAYPDGAWDRPWHGDAHLPAETRAAQEGALTGGEAWLRYALPGRMKESGARAGINVFLRGRVWDLGTEGRMFVLDETTLHTGPRVDGAVIANLWLRRR